MKESIGLQSDAKLFLVSMNAPKEVFSISRFPLKFMFGNHLESLTFMSCMLA